jgi:hypothetical protein
MAKIALVCWSDEMYVISGQKTMKSAKTMIAYAVEPTEIELR